MKQERTAQFWKALEAYEQALRDDLSARTKAWKLDLSRSSEFEVAGGLLARQYTLAIQIARSPSLWNIDAATVLIRSMCDVHISLSWILKEKTGERSRDFIQFGLGQSKLALEHLREKHESEGRKDEELEAHLKRLDEWQNSQQLAAFTVVNVGNWAGEKVREMAEQSGCRDPYRFVYAPYSAATHSMWHHLIKTNLRECEDELHRHHRLPVIPDPPIEFRLMHEAARMASETTAVFDVWAGTESVPCTALDVLDDEMEKCATEGAGGAAPDSKAGPEAGGGEEDPNLNK